MTFSPVALNIIVVYMSVGIGRHLLDAAASAARPEAARIIIWFSQFSISLHKSRKECRDYIKYKKVRWLLYYTMEDLQRVCD